MKASTKYLPDALFRHQHKLEYFSLFLLIFAVIINFDNIRANKTWEDGFFIIMVLIVASVIITSAWVRIQIIKANILTSEIKRNVIPKGPERDALIAKLSTRQREIFELLLLKMPNREIMGELSIEHRAFKSHVNRIYKVFQIKSRKQANRN